MKRRIVGILTLFVLTSAWGQGAPDGICVAPVRPADDQNDVLWQRFLGEIDAFRACVNTQMEWHQNQADWHHAEARVTVERWNTFVRTSLNAPADFPWPPPEDGG